MPEIIPLVRGRAGNLTYTVLLHHAYQASPAAAKPVWWGDSKALWQDGEGIRIRHPKTGPLDIRIILS